MVTKTVLQQINWKKKREVRKRKTKNLAMVVEDLPVSQPISLSLKTMVQNFGIPDFDIALTPEEFSLKLLNAAAEVEHGLLVEYLYAAASIKIDSIRMQVINVAIQEMGHLITVQNLILFMGGSPYYGRLDIPTKESVVPFPFSLEPFKKKSLEKYLIAEMPELNTLDPVTKQLMTEIIQTKQGSLHIEFHRVGIIYSYLYWLFQTSDTPEGPWVIDTTVFPKGKHVQTFSGVGTDTTTQANSMDTEWHADFGGGMIFKTISTRDDALNALFEIASQGEGLSPDADSHFEAFLSIFKEWDDEAEINTINIPVNPTIDPSTSSSDGLNLITDALAILWIQLHNLRYNFLLKCLTGNLLINRNDSPERNKIRLTLINWSLLEMRAFLRPISNQIKARPCKTGGDAIANPACVVYTIMQPTVTVNLNIILTQLLEFSKSSDDILNQILAFSTIGTVDKLLASQLKVQNLNRITAINDFQIIIHTS